MKTAGCLEPGVRLELEVEVWILKVRAIDQNGRCSLDCEPRHLEPDVEFWMKITGDWTWRCFLD